VIDVSLDPFVIPAEDEGERSTNEAPEHPPLPVLADPRDRPRLRPRPVMAGTVTEVDQLVNDCLDPETLGERAGSSSPASAAQWASSNAAAKVGFSTFSRFLLLALLTGMVRRMTTI
jgi:hypothetical protein